jgi:hypothetical protein
MTLTRPISVHLLAAETWNHQMLQCALATPALHVHGGRDIGIMFATSAQAHFQKSVSIFHVCVYSSYTLVLY